VSGSGYGLPLLEILASDSLADVPDAAIEFNVDRTPLVEGLRRSIPGSHAGSA